MAARSKILDSTSLQGHRLVIQIRSPKKDDPSVLASAVPGEPKSATGNWRLLTITKKNRVPPTKPAVVATQETPKKRRRALSYSSSESESESEAEKDKDKDKESAAAKVEGLAQAKEEAAKAVDAVEAAKVQEDEPMPIVTDDVDTVKPGKKRQAKPKTAKATKKARVKSPVPEMAPPTAPPVVEIKLDEPVPAQPAKAAKPKQAKKPAKSKGELVQFLSSGVVEDEEDAYWLGQALAAAHEGVEPDLSDGESDEEENTIKEGHPLHHLSGAWRAEGIKKVLQMAKSEYLPERNRAAVSKEDASALTSGRTARVSGRRLAHDMETTRKTATAATAESDLFAFNQLRIRKKQLRFSRSPIEGYGLYAMETIHPGEMVCEYVGDICRSAVAEIREQRYLKHGIGSSYLFRIDGDMVCDATFCGSVRCVSSLLGPPSMHGY